MATLSSNTAGGEEYTFGAQIRLQITVRQSGTLVDPTTVTLILEEPDLTETTVVGVGQGLVNPSVGVWYYDWTITQAGIHEYRWKTAGPIGAKESYFTALASRVATP